MASVTPRGFLIMLATAVVAAGAFYILREHWAHALGLAPYLLFLACPLMHLFMHHGHKHTANDTTSAASGAKDRASGGCH